MLITDHLRNSRNEAAETVRHPVRASEPRVLIADDQPDVLEALRLLLKAEGFQLETASSPAGVLAAVEAREFDVALIDLNYARDTTSGEEGLNLLSRIQGIDPTLPVVVMVSFRQRAARTPRTLLAAIAEPIPAPSMAMPASDSRRATLLATAPAISG